MPDKRTRGHQRFQGSRVCSTAAGLTGSGGPIRGNVATIAVRKGQAGWLSYFTEFVEKLEASGLVQRAIDLAGDRLILTHGRGKLN